MFTTDAAKLIGITPKALRAFLRTHASGVGSGSRYEFSYDEVMELSNDYWATQQGKSGQTKTEGWLADGGRSALDIRWLGDPAHAATFAAERKARNERLAARLHEVGLGVPQMTDKDLKLNGRAIAMAILNGDME